MLVDISDIFYFFSARGGVGGSPRHSGGGGSVFIQNPTRGGVSRGRGRGAGRVNAANWGIWGGGG